MATIVLVDGAWAGGWDWARMTPHLRAAGHDVSSPTLTRSGEGSHLLSREVDLNTHVDDIANVIKFEDLDDVILVGHSYSGMVITEIANEMPERIAHLVFIDAFVPEAGSGLPEGASSRSALETSARERGDGWRLCVADRLPRHLRT